MGKFVDSLKAARKIEILLAVIAVAVLMIQWMGADLPAEGTEVEQRLERILSGIDGVGSVRVMVTENEEGQPVGALIVAEGADRIGVMLKIQESVAALLNLELSRIEIAPYG